VNDVGTFNGTDVATNDDAERHFEFGPSRVADMERHAELGQVGLSDCIASVVRFKLAHSEFTDNSQVRR